MILKSYLFSLLLVNIASASQLLPRRRFDPYIVCLATAPSHEAGLPESYSETTYRSNLDLCSAAHGARQNVGCLCSNPSTRRDPPRCEEEMADPGLWAASVPADPHFAIDTSDWSFPYWCSRFCYCTTPAKARTDRRVSLDRSPTAPGYPLDIDLNPPPNPVEPPSTASNPPDASGPTVGNQSVDSQSWQNQCGTNCKTNSDCSVKGADSGCTCSTQSEQYQPGKGTVAFRAACIVSLGGKRDEGRPCPCNGTYVSYGCCGASDGMVWEALQYKLGELVDADEL